MNFDLSRFADSLLAPVADAMAALRALGAWGEEEEAAPSNVAARARALLAAMEAEEEEEEDMVMGEGLPERMALPAPDVATPSDGLEDFEVVDAARVALAFRRLAAWRAGYNPYQQIR